MKRFNPAPVEHDGLQMSVMIETAQGDYVTYAEHQRAMFIAGQELYRQGKAHAAELQRLRDRIAQLEEQKRQAVIALGFEDPDKGYK